MQYTLMVKFIIKLLLVAGSLLVAEHFVDGFTVDSFWPTAFVAACFLGIINTIIKPILKLFALPITILTLGLFSLLINILLFWMLTFVPGIEIDGFFAAVWGLFIVSIAGWIIEIIFD